MGWAGSVAVGRGGRGQPMMTLEQRRRADAGNPVTPLRHAVPTASDRADHCEPGPPLRPLSGGSDGPRHRRPLLRAPAPRQPHLSRAPPARGPVRRGRPRPDPLRRADPGLDRRQAPPPQHRTRCPRPPAPSHPGPRPPAPEAERPLAAPAARRTEGDLGRWPAHHLPGVPPALRQARAPHAPRPAPLLRLRDRRPRPDQDARRRHGLRGARAPRPARPAGRLRDPLPGAAA